MRKVPTANSESTQVTRSPMVVLLRPQKGEAVGQALLGRPDTLALRRCGLVAPLEVGQARQREESREALHLLPEGPDGAAVLPVPCQLLLELLQGGSGTDVALKLQSQFYPCAAETMRPLGQQDTPEAQLPRRPSRWGRGSPWERVHPGNDSCMHPSLSRTSLQTSDQVVC